MATVALLAPLTLAVTACDATATSSGRPASTRPSSSTRPATTRPSTPAAGQSSPPSSASGLVVPGTVVRCRGQVVSTARELSHALFAATAGETIKLAPGIYQGDFEAAHSGQPSAPITLCGPRTAVLQGATIDHGYTFYLDKASWWKVEGFTVEGGQKGIVTDHSSHDELYGLYVHSTGDEGIHLREFSSDNVISHCVVRDTGLLVQFFGEGIYVGSANKNWCRYTACHPDASNGNTIIDNNIADTTAENIDIKEGTTGGLISSNHFDGAGMVESAATSWVNVKGNDWVIKNNVGVNSIGNGFAVHQVYPGWGIGNTFAGNRADVNGPGYGVYVQSSDLRTIVACSNVAKRAKLGLSNLPCTNIGAS
ncbi:MAG TPA: right-handed parallel beta-helix repeat-containing protein [Streptosporangiaceae bacterium]|nr:right-handed parallel beta-helix repeat-containing protein [Streptosporangiaceae bacterium]